MGEHGDHWGCISADLPASLADWLMAITQNGEVSAGNAAAKGPGSENFMPGPIGMEYPNTPIRAVAVLCAGNAPGEGTRIWTAYPAAAEGVCHRVRVDRVVEDENGLEAIIHATLGAAPATDGAPAEEGLPVAFFDPFYFRTSTVWRPGERQAAVLAAIAYCAEARQPTPFEITDPVNARRFRQLRGIAEDDPAPVWFQPGRDALMIPRGEPDADDCEILAPVLSVEELDLRGTRVMRVRVILAPGRDGDIELDVYIGEPAREPGARIVPGSYLQAIVWLQGFPPHEVQRAAASKE